MRDPFFAPPAGLVRVSQPISNFLGLSTLPLHIHEVALAWAGYHLIFKVVSPAVSTRLFPDSYPKLPARTKTNWDIKVTSLVQSAFVSSFALAVILGDGERSAMDWPGRIWGYTGAGGSVQGFAAGYFLWDLMVSVTHYGLLGPESLAHAVSALLVTSIGFRPFANYYGLNFILYELSTPFLNIHWFFDKLGYTGSSRQLYNGIVLLATFFCSRVVWGNYQSYRIYSDVWTALHSSDTIAKSASGALRELPKSLANEMGVGSYTLPMWLVVLYLGSNTMLNGLNVYWFSQMIKALRKRFQPAKSGEKPSEKEGEGAKKRLD